MLFRSQPELESLASNKDEASKSVHELDRARRTLEEMVKELEQKVIELEDENT